MEKILSRMLVLVALILPTVADAGGEIRTWKITTPPGSKFEANIAGPYKVEQLNGAVLVHMPSEASFVKAKARWRYGREACYFDGPAAKVLTDMQRCTAQESK